jgi:hypothetical protein
MRRLGVMVALGALLCVLGGGGGGGGGGAGDTPPPPDSKPADPAVRQYLQLTRTAMALYAAPFCLSPLGDRTTIPAPLEVTAPAIG